MFVTAAIAAFIFCPTKTGDKKGKGNGNEKGKKRGILVFALW